MPTTSFRARATEAVIALIWSLWAELGAGGWERRHTSVAIDVEPLLIATTHPRIQRQDRRLVDQAQSWSITNVRLVSAVRLRNLLPEFDSTTQEAFGDLALAVNARANANWPRVKTSKRVASPTRRSTGRDYEHSPSSDLSRASLLQLRLRGAIGVSVRAEIIRVLLGEPINIFMGVSQVATSTAFKRHNVAESLDQMVRAGIVRERGGEGWRQFQLARRDSRESDPWSTLFGPLPASYPDWTAIFRLSLAILELAWTDEHTPPRLYSVEIARLQREHAMDLARTTGSGFTLRQPSLAGTEPGEDFERQAVDLLERWSNGEPWR